MKFKMVPSYSLENKSYYKYSKLGSYEFVKCEKRDPYFNLQMNESSLFDQTNVNQKLIPSFKRKNIKPRIYNDIKLNYCDYTNSNYSLVPEALKLVVMHIESICLKYNNWFDAVKVSRKLTKDDHCRTLTPYMKNNKILEIQYKDLKVINLQECLLLFTSMLYTFQPKLIRIDRSMLINMSTKSLYDRYLQPRTNFKVLLKHTILKHCNRIMTITLCFIMKHLLLIWKKNNYQVEIKHNLSKIYGHLLVELDLKVRVNGSALSSESSIIEMIFDCCDYEYWTMLEFPSKITVQSDQGFVPPHYFLSPKIFMNY